MNKNQNDIFHPLIYAIVAVYNNIEDCKVMIDGFFAQNYSNKRLIVVNNGNPENIFYYLANNNDVSIIHFTENKGWAIANNAGIGLAIESNADYVLLLNDDLVFENNNLLKDFIESVSINKTSEYINSIVIKENTYNKNIEIIGHSVFNNSKYPFIKQKEKYASNETFIYCDYTSGAFMLIPVNIVKIIGDFDANLFCYSEDKDFCFRAWQKDIPSVVYKNLNIYHKGSASSQKELSFKTYYIWRNFFYFLLKHKANIEHFNYFKRKKTLQWFKQFIIIIKNTYKNNIDSKYKMSKALFLAAYHGLITHKTGEYWKLKYKK